MNKKNKKIFMIALLCLLFSTPAFASNWFRIGEGHYIDADSIKPYSTYGTYTMDTKYMGLNMPLEEVNGHKVWTITTNSFVDCRNAYAKTLSYTGYDEKNNVVVKGRNIQKQWLDINSPGSRANESYSFVCTDKYIYNRPGYHKLWWY